MIEIKYKTANNVGSTTYRLQENWFNKDCPNFDNIATSKGGVTLIQGDRRAHITGTPTEKEQLAYNLLLSANMQRAAAK